MIEFMKCVTTIYIYICMDIKMQRLLHVHYHITNTIRSTYTHEINKKKDEYMTCYEDQKQKNEI